MTAVLALAILLQTLSAGTPLLLAAIGGVFGERSGVVNIGLEGLMLLGAFAAVFVSVTTGSPWLGVLAAAGAGIFGAALFATFAVQLKRDHVIVGTTLNFLALGLTGVLFRSWQNAAKGQIPLAPTLPLVITYNGSSLNALTFAALLLVPVASWLLFRTRLGVTLRTIGEVPAAAAASGSRVNRLRFLTCLFTGALCGMGGAALSIGYSNAFAENMTGGRGFIALAVVVFGRWSPLAALGASLLFASAEVAQTQLQAVPAIQTWLNSLKIGDTYPLFLMLPYLLTLVALALRGAKVKPPAALGQPFEQG